MATALFRNGVDCHKIRFYNDVEKQDISFLTADVENSPSPTLYYTFETGSGTSVVDRSVGGTAHNGTFDSSAPSWDTSDPKSGSYSLNCDAAVGDDEHFTIPDHAELDFSKDDSFSISAWVKARNSGYCALFTKRGGAPSYTGFYLGAESGKLDFYLTYDWATSDEGLNVRGTTGSPYNDLDDGSWHHLVVTYSGTATAAGVRCWVDGSEDTGLSASSTKDAVSGDTTNALDVVVGADSATGSLAFGDIDELTVWKGTVLTALQVETLYNSGGTPPNIARGL